MRIRVGNRPGQWADCGPGACLSRVGRHESGALVTTPKYRTARPDRRVETCRHGHDMSDAYVYPDGRRACRTCRRNEMLERTERNRAA